MKKRDKQFFGSYIDSPCLNCERRHDLCHKECADYQEFKKLNKEMSDKVKKAKYLENLTPIKKY